MFQSIYVNIQHVLVFFASSVKVLTCDCCCVSLYQTQLFSKATKANRVINYFPSAGQSHNTWSIPPTIFVIHHSGIHFPHTRQTILGQPTHSSSHSDSPISPPRYWLPFDKSATTVFWWWRRFWWHLEHLYHKSSWYIDNFFHKCPFIKTIASVISPNIQTFFYFLYSKSHK